MSGLCASACCLLDGFWEGICHFIDAGNYQGETWKGNVADDFGGIALHITDIS